MSQYPPPNGYGQYYGQPPLQQYGYQFPPNFLVPPFNQPYNPAIAEAASNTVQSSFAFNANHIPGLGIAGGQGSISHPVVPALPAAGDLTQVPAPARDVSLNHNQNTATLPPPPKNTVPQNTYPAMDNDIEEGELNEEQFEDLYEPQESIQQIPDVRARQKPPSSANDSGVVSAADTPDAGFYGNDEEDTGMATTKKSDAAVSRERSRSYSPFLSPAGTPPRIQSTQQPASNAIDGGNNNPAVPGLHVSSQTIPTGPAKLGSTQHTSQHPSHQQHHAGQYSFKTVEEARKEVQKAILRLWPLGVRFQQYIDEGFDPDLIKSLFTQLNLDIKDAQSNQQDKPGASKPGQIVEKQQTQKAEPAVAAKPQTMASGDTKKGEERKDRIARLLAAKAAQPKQPPKEPPKAPEKFSPPKAPAAMTRNKAWGEKELLLQQKIAALQEAQAAKAAEKRLISGPGPLHTYGGAPSALVQPPTGPAVKPALSAPKPPTGPSKLTEKTANSSSASTIPGLLLSTIPTGPARNLRKRPVASDFVDIPPADQPAKRPFGQHQKETSLVIDVSDASEDEEMDIDAESPLEDSSSSNLGGLPSQRGPAIRDFPPLTDTPPPRQFSSPVPSSNTPLGRPILSRKRETELDIKEKEIQEMRRKIAEIEARRKAKQSSGGPLTPTQAGQTPESKQSEHTSNSDREPSAQLSSTATSANPSHKIERRGRIVSLDLPRIDETIEEKRNRLKQLQEEEMRLQAEIESQLAKKKLLTEELEQLGDNSSDDAPQANGIEKPSSPMPNETADAPQPSSGAISTVGELDEAPADVSMDEDESSADEDAPDNNVESRKPEVTKTADAGGEESTPEVTTEAPGSQGVTKQNVADNSGPEEMGKNTSPGPVLENDSSREVDRDANPPESDDDPAPMEIESVSSSPTPYVNPTSPSNEVAGDDIQPTDPSSQVLLDQLSSVTKPREAVQEIEAQPTREVDANPEQQTKSGFVPYESPLRYFRAYRFHPSYSETVRGGLKSLTYSNRIDPQKPFCPSELAGQQCPADCEFQHLRSIGTPGDRILLELGKADEYSGEQKTRFIQGLRKLLGDIRENGRPDFDTIAREIIAFRSRILGDPSKVLPLEGVTI